MTLIHQVYFEITFMGDYFKMYKSPLPLCPLEWLEALFGQATLCVWTNQRSGLARATALQAYFIRSVCPVYLWVSLVLLLYESLTNLVSWLLTDTFPTQYACGSILCRFLRSLCQTFPSLFCSNSC